MRQIVMEINALLFDMNSIELLLKIKPNNGEIYGEYVFRWFVTATQQYNNNRQWCGDCKWW